MTLQERINLWNEVRTEVVAAGERDYPLYLCNHLGRILEKWGFHSYSVEAKEEIALLESFKPDRKLRIAGWWPSGELAPRLETIDLILAGLKQGQRAEEMQKTNEFYKAPETPCAELPVLYPMREACPDCGHIWGAYEDKCHCGGEPCHNADICQLIDQLKPEITIEDVSNAQEEITQIARAWLEDDRAREDIKVRNFQRIKRLEELEVGPLLVIYFNDISSVVVIRRDKGVLKVEVAPTMSGPIAGK